MDEETAQLVKQTMIRECIGIALLLGVLWATGPGKVWLAGMGRKIRAPWAPVDRFEGDVRQFASEMSRWEHEQAAKQDRPPAAGGGCLFGCR